MVNAITPEEGILKTDSARNSQKIVATHNGVFHADDVFAVAAMMLVYPDAKVVRTRDPKALEAANIVIDVGGVHDLVECKFDHHQKGGAGSRKNGIPYAAFGLVWGEWNYEIVTKVTGIHPPPILGLSEIPLQMPDESNPEICWGVDKVLVQAIDAADNGYVTEGDVRNTPFYGVSSVISAMNPTWQETDTTFDEAFMAAVEVAKDILIRAIKGVAAEVAAGVVVAKALADDRSRGSTGIMILEKFVPWTDTLLDQDRMGMTKFVVFQAETGDWRIQAVPDAPGSFGMRKPLPESWAGLRGAELAEKTGVSDAIFCHNGRFIAGAQSREGIMQLAIQAINA